MSGSRFGGKRSCAAKEPQPEDPGVRKRTRMSRRRKAESGNGAGSDGARRKSAPCRSDGPRKGGLRNQTEGLIPRDGCASAVRQWWRRRCGQVSVEYAWKEDSLLSGGRQGGAENIGQGAERMQTRRDAARFAVRRSRRRGSGLAGRPGRPGSAQAAGPEGRSSGAGT